MPLLFIGAVLLRFRGVQACQICNQIVASSIAEEKCEGRHDRGSADFAGIVEMHLEPQGRATDAYLRQVGPLAAISYQRRMLLVDLVYAFNGSPHEDVGGAGANVLRVAVDASLGYVDMAAAFDG